MDGGTGKGKGRRVADMIRGSDERWQSYLLSGEVAKRRNEGVVLFHGILKTSRCMDGLARHLRALGYDVLNVDYPSTKHGIGDLAEIVHDQVSEFGATVGRIHFVGFSMGGLLARAYIKLHRPEHLGRVVMLGTPNAGSEVADLLKNVGAYRKVFGPAGQQLVTDQSLIGELFGHVDFELGIVAGVSRNPFSRLIFSGPNDGKVSVERSKLVGMVDHVVVRTNHTFMPASRKVWKHAASFIADGKFGY